MRKAKKIPNQLELFPIPEEKQKTIKCNCKSCLRDSRVKRNLILYGDQFKLIR